MNKERIRQTQKVYGVLKDLAKPYLSAGENPPPFQVVEVARESGLKPLVVARIINKGLVLGKDGSALEANLKENTIDNINGLKEAALLRAPFKRAVQKSDYRSRAPGGGPVVKRRINKASLNSRLVELGTNRLRIELKPVDEEEAAMKKETERAKKKKRLELRQILKMNMPKEPDSSISQLSIQQYMEKTLYWSGKEKQTITPDFLKIDRTLLEQVNVFVGLQTALILNVVRQYKKDLELGEATDLVGLIEGNKMSTEMRQTLRNWTLATPDDEVVNYYRPDLGIYMNDEGNTAIYSCEINIMTAGTPPAILYREAQRDEISNLNLVSPTRGALEFFWEEAMKSPNRSVLIVGTSPLKSNQELYERSHSDMANLLTELGINSRYTRIENYYAQEGDLIYWRIQSFQEETLSELNSPQGKQLLELYKNGKVKIFPQPVLPFMNTKAFEAIVWDERFENLVPEGIKQFIPETQFINESANVENWREYIIKRAQGDGGVTLGIEVSKTKFQEKLGEAMQNPGEYVLQRFIPPLKVSFRVPDENKRLIKRQFFIRLEPTVAITQEGVEIIDLFFTGRYDTRKVAGGKKSIMGTVVLEN